MGIFLFVIGGRYFAYFYPYVLTAMLRQPLETGKVTISRAQMTVTYPARFLLLAATNPCPCGYLGSHTRYCTCTPRQIQAYQSRISGPIEDRIDILLSLLPVPFHNGKPENNESSEQIRNRVSIARERQYERYGKMITNSSVPVETFMRMISLSEGQKRFLHNLAQKQHWSNRVHMKMIRLARTISDLRGENTISDESLWEAVTLRKTHQQNQPAKKGSWKHGS
ncbi:MAG: ATP-binding protein [Bacillota bacterium]